MKISFKILAASLILILGISCGDSKKEEVTEIKPLLMEDEVSENQETILYSLINDLNVRDEAGRKGKVIAKLSYGQRTLFLDKETDYKESIIMRGIERYESWKKVRFSSGPGGEAVEGWVYGGGMKTESELFKKVGDNLYERALENVTRAELSKIIGMTLTLDYVYNGVVNYTKLSGGYLKNKDFSVTGLPKNRSNVSKDVNVFYSGQYDTGMAVGVFTKTFIGHKSETTTQIMFENGRCVWSEIKGMVDGEELYKKIDNPNGCNFQFIEDATSTKQD